MNKRSINLNLIDKKKTNKEPRLHSKKNQGTPKKRSKDRNKINKKIIKARGYAYSFSEGGSLKVSSFKMPEAKYVFEIIWELDRETGLTKAYFNNKKGKILDNMECQKIKKKNGFPISYLEEIFEHIFVIIKNGLLKDGIFKITGFGTFKVLFKKERLGINPKTKILLVQLQESHQLQVL